MLTKELFFKFINEFKIFDEAVERLEIAISGRKYGCNLYDSDWYNSVGIMLDTFVESHFTNDGQDLVSWWLFEDVDKIITQKVDPDLFNGASEIEYNVNELEDLWNYMVEYKKDYFLND